MGKKIVATLVAALSLVVVGSAAAGAGNLPPYIGDPNAPAGTGLFVPGGDQNFNTFLVHLSQVPDNAGPKN